MIKIFFLLFTISISTFAIELDPKVLHEIINNNPNAYKEKFLLAKYYEKNSNDLKALALLREILQKKPKYTNAIKLKEKIIRKDEIREIFKEASLTQPVSKKEAQRRLQTYNDDKNYQFFTTLYEALIDSNINLEDTYHIEAANIYLKDTRFRYTKKALKRVKKKNNFDALAIEADTCYFQGDYKCSSKLFEKLYKTNHKLEYALKLINSDIYLGKTAKAKRFYSYIHRKYPNNTRVKNIRKKLQTSEDNYLNNKKIAFEKNKTLETLEPYTIALNEVARSEEAINITHNYNKQYATNKSLILEAKYLLWDKKTQDALNILKKTSLNSDLEANLLLGQICSWDQKFKEAKHYLNKTIQQTNDKKLLYDAKKALAFTLMWENNSIKAKKIFKQLKKQNPLDIEVKEALMDLEHNYRGLLKIYTKKVKKSNKPQDVKKLAEIYIGLNQPDKAVKLLKKYLQTNPQDLQANKKLALILINKKDYYQGFGYLEYYATQKQNLQSTLTLAKNYYWAGFSKEALDILDSAIKKYPSSQELLKLKAKILKIAPSFTRNNNNSTLDSYFNNITSRQLKLADTLYFDGHYKSSLGYYEAYLNQHPDDYDVHYRYAFALENAQEHGKAEGEFYLSLKTKKSNEVSYHYAYNMMKNHKLKKAKKLLLKLKHTTDKQIDPKLNKFLMKWKSAWESKDFRNYSSFYSSKFTQKNSWRSKKQNTFKNAKYISVKIKDPLFQNLDTNHYIIRFFQEYSTNKKSDKGYKTLHLRCDRTKQECKITKELWKASKYQKTLMLTPYIDNALKEIKRLESLPLASRYSKKKTLYS